MSDLTGQEVRGYLLQERIGVGGFAAVYRAQQVVVEREVAIKAILSKYANNPEFVRRFEIEAQLIARLDHLHIVPLYDYWREPNNAYLVMRWLRGGSLYDSMQRQGAWELPAIARLLDQIAAALAAAHRRGVIHQDLTPTNILLDEEHNAYLADFGIAKDLIRSLAEADSQDKRVYGSPAYVAPERIKHEAVTPQTDIYSLGIILYELLTGELPFDAPTPSALISKHLSEPVPRLQAVRADLPDDLNPIILRATAKNPQERYPTAPSLAADFRQVLASTERSFGKTFQHDSTSQGDASVQGLGTFVLPTGTLVVAEALPPQNPYKGLRAFDEVDADVFFGREALIQQLLRRLTETEETHRFLAVVGPSGSGKSSVVKAGLIPALRRGALPGSERWFIAKMVPGEHPFQELETALLGVTFKESARVFDGLRQGERELSEIIRRILPEDGAELVLVIDQFEEVFTLVQDEIERTRFLKSLFTAVTERQSRLRLIIMLRADFYDRPLLYPGFGELIRRRTEVVLPLSASELREAIMEPAQQAGLTLEPGLVAEMVAAVTAQPGALPLLQYALTELFDRRENDTLTLDGYHASGGVLGALARRAEELYTGMNTTHQEVARQLFLRLISLGEGAENTRRRVHWAELMSIGQFNRSAMQAVLDVLGKFRLITFDRDPQTREPTVEIAHEALTLQWGRLRGWLADNREALLTQRRLALLAEEWAKASRHPSFLATGARLVQFETLVSSKSLVLTRDEVAYLDASMSLRRRAAQRLRLFIAALVVFTLVSLALAAFALDRQNRADNARQKAEVAQAVALEERDRADLQAKVSRSRELAVTALINRSQIDLALLLSVEALNAANTFEARNSLLTSLQSAPYLSSFLNGHVAPVRSVAFSPDGLWLASGSRDGIILVWDVKTRQIARQLSLGSEIRTNALAFSPDSRIIAAGGTAGQIRLWDAQTGEPIGEPFAGQTEDIWSIAFAPGGKVLASGSADNTVQLWDVETGQLIGQPLVGHTDLVYSVAFSPDGRVLASGGADNTVRLWDVQTGQSIGQPIEGHTNWVWSVAFSPDGRWLASGSADGTIVLWDVDTGEPVLPPLTGHTDWVRSVAFSPDGAILVSGSADGTVRLWDAMTGQPVIPPLTQHRDAVWSVSFSPDGYTIASGGEDTRVIVWDIRVPDPLRQELGSHLEPVLSVAFSPNGRIVASAGGSLAGGGQDNAIRLWDVQTRSELAVLTGHSDTVSTIAFSPDGRRLASASFDQTLVLWDVQSGQPVFDPLPGHNGPLTSLAFSPDGQTIASGSDDGHIVLWDIAGDTPSGVPLPSSADSVLSLAFSPDGQVLASGHRNGSIILWDVSSGQPMGEPLRGHGDAVTSVAFRPDGKMLASGSRDNTIILWDTATRQPVGPPFTGHSNWVLSVSFSPDGQMLVSGSRDTSLMLWDVATGRPIGLPLSGHLGWVTSVAFSPDGQTVVSGGTDNRVLLWDVSLESWKKEACQIANRNLNLTEQEQFLGNVPFVKTCPSLP